MGRRTALALVLAALTAGCAGGDQPFPHGVKEPLSFHSVNQVTRALEQSGVGVLVLRIPPHLASDLLATLTSNRDLELEITIWSSALVADKYWGMSRASAVRNSDRQFILRKDNVIARYEGPDAAVGKRIRETLLALPDGDA